MMGNGDFSFELCLCADFVSGAMNWCVDSLVAGFVSCDWKAEAYGDMIEMGVMDSFKTVKTALEDSVSVAGMLLSTAAVISPEKAYRRILHSNPKGLLNFYFWIETSSDHVEKLQERHFLALTKNWAPNKSKYPFCWFNPPKIYKLIVFASSNTTEAVATPVTLLTLDTSRSPPLVPFHFHLLVSLHCHPSCFLCFLISLGDLCQL